MRKILLCLIAALLACVCAMAEDIESVNRGIYAKVAAAVAGKTSLPMSDLTVEVALSMLETPYVGGTIEGENEELRIFLDKTDCILFVEACVCMALTFKGMAITQGSSPQPAVPSYELFCDNVRNMRYRGGRVDGYASRIHYTSEWILQAEDNAVLEEFSDRVGTTREQSFSFMTSHTDLYPCLKDNPGQTELVREAERRLEASGPYYSLSQAKLNDPAVSGRIRSGDIIFIISGAAGLDISHVALAYRHNGAMHFIHASSKAGKVIIEPKTLAEYATRGIRVARLL